MYLWGSNGLCIFWGGKTHTGPVTALQTSRILNETHSLVDNAGCPCLFKVKNPFSLSQKVNSNKCCPKSHPHGLSRAAQCHAGRLHPLQSSSGLRQMQGFKDTNQRHEDSE